MFSADGIIAAVATAWGESAIAIVRVSGNGSVALADKFFRGVRPLADEPARRMSLGNIAEGGAVVDQVLAVRFERGSSYTGEESVEIHCHGGTLAAGRCMDILTGAGVRVAYPGEFTKRAFLSGRMDLVQVEAVFGVIKARSDAELASSQRALQGEMSESLRKLSGELTGLRASIESRIDFPEDIEDDEPLGYVRAISDIKKGIASLIVRCRVGLTLKNGVRAAIIGRPNVGKSSLLNAMCGTDRAIVTEIPGTTRDTLDASFVHKGLYVTIVDTAGAAKSADMCILVIDSSEPLSEYDRVSAETAVSRPMILAVNKSDLRPVVTREALESLCPCAERVKISALVGTGIDDLKDAIFDEAMGNASPSEGLLATERMINALVSAEKCADDAISALEYSGYLDATGSLLAEASEYLASPLGGDASEELLDAIFSTFCVGK